MITHETYREIGTNVFSTTVFDNICTNAILAGLSNTESKGTYAWNS